MKKPTLLFCIIVAAVPLSAQYGEISGKVFDQANGESIPGAHLILRQDSSQVIETGTGNNGEFVLKPLPPGYYDLTVSFVGYGEKTFRHIEVKSDAITWQECPLKFGIVMDSAVTIRAPLVDAGNPTEELVLKGPDLRKEPVHSPEDAANLSAQVYQSDRGGGLFIAGSRADATLYVIDGVEVIGSTYIPMNAIREIKVITGGIPAKYGDVTGGIIEITTKNYTGIF